MRRNCRWMPALLLVLAGLGLAGRADAAGYSIYEQGSKALGMAGAFTAQADDPSAIFYNPAGIGRLQGTQVNVGAHLIGITREFAGEAPYPGYGVKETAPTVYGTPVNLYMARRLSPGWAAGLGVYNPFGLKTEWDDKDNYSGRFVSREASITPFFITPVLAWNPTSRVSIAAGPSYATSKIHLERNVGVNNPLYGDPRFTGTDQLLDLGTVDIDGSGHGIGWTAGLKVDLTDDLKVGAVYRSAIDIDYEGSDADFAYAFKGSGNATLDALLGNTLRSQFPDDQKATVSLPFPSSLAVGLEMHPADSWTVEIDALWTGWNRLQTVGLNFDDESISTNIEENWHNALSLRAGAEYRMNEQWALRGGWYFDESPQPTKAVDPLLPDADRNGLTLGAGWNHGAWRVDGYALWLMVSERSTMGRSLRGYDGIYDSEALVGGLNLTRSF